MKVVKIKSADGPLTKILIRSKKDTRLFKLTELVYCRAERNYTRLHFADGNSCLSYVSLSKVAGV